MAKSIKTHLFCFDDFRSFTEDVKKKFDDHSRYIIDSYQTKEELIRKFKIEKVSQSCKIAILGVHDNREQIEMAEQLVAEIIKTDPDTGIIILCSPEKTEEIKKNLKFNIDSYIPQNGNAILRIHNTVKKLFSEHYMKVYRKRRNRSLLVLLAFVILAGLAILVSFLKFPEYF